MDLKNIETSDFFIKETIKKENEISILFSKIYDINKMKYIDNVILIIKEWSVFFVKLYISEAPFSKPKEKFLTDENFECFDLIQDVIINDNELILSGYSKDSSHWMEYVFTDCKTLIFKEKPNGLAL